jgi:hypothetical protein
VPQLAPFQFFGQVSSWHGVHHSQSPRKNQHMRRIITLKSFIVLETMLDTQYEAGEFIEADDRFADALIAGGQAREYVAEPKAELIDALALNRM